MIKIASPTWPVVAVFVLLVVGCAQDESGPIETDPVELDAPDQEVVDETSDEVLTVVNSLFQAMQARDSTRIQMTLHPDAQFTSVNLTGEAPVIRRVEGSAFATSVGQPGPAYVERMFDPVVEYSENFANVWTYYDFHVADSLSHCGHDAIQLVRNATGAWRIVGITYTRTACE